MIEERFDPVEDIKRFADELRKMHGSTIEVTQATQELDRAVEQSLSRIIRKRKSL